MSSMLKVIPVALCMAALSACGSGDSEPDMGAALSAIGGGVPAPLTTPAPIPDIQVVNTKSLVVSDDFTFDTAQQINVDFDLEAARNTEGAVSICTEYSQDDAGFDINYGSCTVQGTMTDGVFTHAMEVTNEFDSVVAVVWFQNEAVAPVFREFTVKGESADRSTKSVNGEKVLVWR